MVQCDSSDSGWRNFYVLVLLDPLRRLITIVRWQSRWPVVEGCKNRYGLIFGMPPRENECDDLGVAAVSLSEEQIEFILLKPKLV